jgi:hypothetical protein
VKEKCLCCRRFSRGSKKTESLEMSEKETETPLPNPNPRMKGYSLRRLICDGPPTNKSLTSQDVDVGCGYFESVANTTSRTHSPASVAGIVPAVIYW